MHLPLADAVTYGMSHGADSVADGCYCANIALEGKTARGACAPGFEGRPAPVGAGALGDGKRTGLSKR